MIVLLQRENVSTNSILSALTVLLPALPVCVFVCLRITPHCQMVHTTQQFTLLPSTSITPQLSESLPCCNAKPASLRSHKFLTHSPKPEIFQNHSPVSVWLFPFHLSLSCGWLTDGLLVGLIRWFIFKNKWLAKCNNLCQTAWCHHPSSFFVPFTDESNASWLLKHEKSDGESKKSHLSKS